MMNAKTTAVTSSSVDEYDEEATNVSKAPLLQETEASEDIKLPILISAFYVILVIAAFVGSFLMLRRYNKEYDNTAVQGATVMFFAFGGLAALLALRNMVLILLRWQRMSQASKELIGLLHTPPLLTIVLVILALGVLNGDLK